MNPIKLIQSARRSPLLRIRYKWVGQWVWQPKQADWLISRDECQLGMWRSPVHPKPERLIREFQINYAIAIANIY